MFPEIVVLVAAVTCVAVAAAASSLLHGMTSRVFMLFTPPPRARLHSVHNMLYGFAECFFSHPCPLTHNVYISGDDS